MDRHDEHMIGNGDHFNFGNSLTVKGGILTVADDLLKNDGKKFLDMMERLAERRMQREEEAGLDQDEYYDDDDEDDDAYEDEVDEVSGDANVLYQNFLAYDEYFFLLTSTTLNRIP
jgi:hypothetical protein